MRRRLGRVYGPSRRAELEVLKGVLAAVVCLLLVASLVVIDDVRGDWRL